MSKPRFLMPIALSVAALLGTSPADAEITKNLDSTVQFNQSAQVNSLSKFMKDNFVLKKSSSALKFAGHYSHRSHSSHSSHSSHRSHYSSSW